MQYATAEPTGPMLGERSGAWSVGGQWETQVDIGTDFRPPRGTIMSTQSSSNGGVGGGSGGPRAPPPVCTKWMASVGPCCWIRCDAHHISEWVTVTNRHRTVGAELDLRALLDSTGSNSSLTCSSSSSRSRSRASICKSVAGPAISASVQCQGSGEQLESESQGGRGN